jgi:hypothetical protein
MEEIKVDEEKVDKELDHFYRVKRGRWLSNR